MYADLAAVLTALKPLERSRVWPSCSCRSWTCRWSPPRISVATVLGHSSGQWIGVRLDADATDPAAGMNDLQALGNAIAYLRRYGLSAITGLAQQDTDGAGGSGQPERDPRQEPAGQKLRAEIDGMIGKLIARQGRGSRGCVADARARCRNWRRCGTASRSWPPRRHNPLRLRRRLPRLRPLRRQRPLSRLTRRSARPRSTGC